jgi:tetratricopeptide (TPR) repeat protein
MKAEHRKELQTNALADRIGRFFKGLRSTASSNGIAILVVVLVVVILFGVYRYFSWSASRARSEVWVKLDRATTEELAGKTDQSMEQLEKVVKNNPGSKAALMARFQIAQINLMNRGINLLPQPGRSAEALKNLDRAEEEYEKLVKECKDDATWEPKALLALAKIAKTRAVKDVKNLDRALELYKKLGDKYGDTAAGQEAAAEIKALQNAESRAALEKFYTSLGRDFGVGHAGL